MINKMQIFAASSILSVFATSLFASNGDGWYTQDQASHGHLLFNNYCAECHRPDLTGAIGPALKGKDFDLRFDLTLDAKAKAPQALGRQECR